MGPFGSAGTANSSYGFVGTDFQLKLGTFLNGEPGIPHLFILRLIVYVKLICLVGKKCTPINYLTCGRNYIGVSQGNSVKSPSSFYYWFHGTPQTISIPFSIPLTNNANSVFSYHNIIN